MAARQNSSSRRARRVNGARSAARAAAAAPSPGRRPRGGVAVVGVTWPVLAMGALSAQASRLASRKAPAPRAAAAYSQSMPSPAQGDRNRTWPTPTGSTTLRELATMAIGR